MNDNEKVTYSNPNFMGLMDEGMLPKTADPVAVESDVPVKKPRPVRMVHLVTGQNILIVADAVDDSLSDYILCGCCPACGSVLVRDA